jgi:hypothetical protein
MRLFSRRALQYALARYSAIGLSVVPLSALAGYLYKNRYQQLGEIFFGSRLLLFVSGAVLGIATLRYRKTLLDWIDRYFSPEQYEARKMALLRYNKNIRTPPGLYLRPFAEFLFSRGVFELVLEPTLRDLYEEYCEALKAGRTRKAAWVRIRGYWSFWSAIVAQLSISMLKRMFELWKAS